MENTPTEAPTSAPADASVANFSGYTDFSKILLSFAMLLGRLEIFPLIIALSPSTWMKKG